MHLIDFNKSFKSLLAWSVGYMGALQGFTPN